MGGWKMGGVRRGGCKMGGVVSSSCTGVRGAVLHLNHNLVPQIQVWGGGGGGGPRDHFVPSFYTVISQKWRFLQGALALISKKVVFFRLKKRRPIILIIRGGEGGGVGGVRTPDFDSKTRAKHVKTRSKHEFGVPGCGVCVFGTPPTPPFYTPPTPFSCIYPPHIYLFPTLPPIFIQSPPYLHPVIYFY